MRVQPLYVAGASVETATTDTIRSPFDGEVAGIVAVGGIAEMESVIAQARDHVALARALPRHRRHDVLEKAARRIEEQTEPLAQLITAESGKPMRFARAEVARAVTTFELAAANALTFSGESIPLDIDPRGEGRIGLYDRVARGAVGAIAPFNFPLNLVAHKLAPAIAVGAPVVLKPPPQSPLTSFALADILYECGLPKPMLSVIHCKPDVAQRLAEDDRIAVLSFTGSAEVGWKLKSLAGKKQVLLELGGNAPCVVDEGCDVDAIAPAVALAAFAQAGQVCIKVQRIFVHDSLALRFTERFVAASNALACGDPKDERTIVGPLIEMKHVDRVLGWIDEAMQRGGKRLCGGERVGPLRSIVTPTVLTGVPADAKVACEEVFGPVAVIEPFATFETALERCNATRYGLQAGVFTPSLERAMLAFRALEYGGVMINDVPTYRIDNFPYGGTKDSGFGREGVRFAMEEMTEPRVLVLRGRC